MFALRRLARPAVATTAAVLLLAGCGGDDDNGDDTSSSPSSASENSQENDDSDSDGDLATFCAQAQEFAGALQEVDASDPESIPPALEEASSVFDDTEPPAEIADEWSNLGDAMRNWADTANSVDITSPEGAQELVTATQEFQEVFTGPDGQAVDEFGSANCV